MRQVRRLAACLRSARGNEGGGVDPRHFLVQRRYKRMCKSGAMEDRARAPSEGRGHKGCVALRTDGALSIPAQTVHLSIQQAPTALRFRSSFVQLVWVLRLARKISCSA